MSVAEPTTLKSKALGLVAGLALLLGLAGAGLAAHNVSAQSPTATASPTQTETPAGTETPSAPTTGTGVNDDSGTSIAVPLAALAVVMLGGGIAFALASRNQG